MTADDKPEGAFGHLIPELRDWNGGAGIDVDSWICCVGNFEHAIGYGRLFWPEFVAFDGCVFGPGFTESNYRNWMDSTKGDKRAVQVVMNHQHILDLFGDQALSPTRDQVVYLGRLLKDVWSAKLKRDFPGWVVVVSFPEEHCEDLLDYEITFFREPE